MPGIHEQSAVFIDAGFLLAVGSTKTTGTSLRSSTVVNTRKLIVGIVERTHEDAGLTPLRVYWYDASHNGVMTDAHKKIAMIDDVKVRLGRIGINGAQKGVDLRLGLDLVEVARNRSARVAYLFCGDDDIAEAVEAAQDQGMKVVLVGLEDPNRRVGLASVAEHLALQVDRILTLPVQLIRDCFEPSMSHRSKESAEGISTVAAASAPSGKDSQPGEDTVRAAGTSTSAGKPCRCSAVEAARTVLAGVSLACGCCGKQQLICAECGRRLPHGMLTGIRTLATPPAGEAAPEAAAGPADPSRTADARERTPGSPEETLHPGAGTGHSPAERARDRVDEERRQADVAHRGAAANRQAQTTGGRADTGAGRPDAAAGAADARAGQEEPEGRDAGRGPGTDANTSAEAAADAGATAAAGADADFVRDATSGSGAAGQLSEGAETGSAGVQPDSAAAQAGAADTSRHQEAGPRAEATGAPNADDASTRHDGVETTARHSSARVDADQDSRDLSSRARSSAGESHAGENGVGQSSGSRSDGSRHDAGHDAPRSDAAREPAPSGTASIASPDHQGTSPEHADESAAPSAPHRDGIQTAQVSGSAAHRDGVHTTPASPRPGPVRASGRPGPSGGAAGAQPAPHPVPAPSPAFFARTLQPSAQSSAAPAYSTVYSTSTDDSDSKEETLFDVIEDVAANMAKSWLNSATQFQVEEVLHDYPYLEPDLDRALLQDCAQRIGETETTSQMVRKHLRDSFWAAVRNRDY